MAYNSRFDTPVTSVLKKAGWYEGRKIDMSEHLKIFESLGIDVFDKAKEFIQEFDGLKIPATDFRFDENNKNHFHYFDVMHDIKGMYDILIEKKEDCEKILMNRNFCNERVFPVGGLHGWDLGLYITESGKLINDVRVYSNTIEEGVKNLVLHKSVGSIADLLPITPVKSTVQNEKN
ncbi:MAG: SUKH-3 domain-containing protein [Acutalibacteraceae bacterium]|nr:SUKH-3 domain-containing protein [Acutalibacteraceae bacterium]